MKITIYELLGLVKDGKAPKKIRYNNEVWELDDDNEYENNNYDKSLLEKLAYELYTLDFINDKVEIIEEPKKIKKLDLNYKDIIYGTDFKEQILSYCDNLQYKINELIDEINNLKENKHEY